MGKERLNFIPNEAFGITDEEAQELSLASKEATFIHLPTWRHFTPEFVNTKVQNLDLKSVNREMTLAQKNFTEARLSQPEGKVVFNTDLPVTIFTIGDLHYGSIYSDHKEIARKFKAIKEAPNAYVVFMSNLIDNGIPSQYPDVMLANSIPPDKQVVSMRKMVQELNDAGKVLGAVTSPCHEGWTYRKCGQDINALIFGFESRHFPVLENGGELTLSFPKFRKLMVLYHMCGPFESSFNETHALRQMNRLRLQMRADIVVGAHKHNAAANMVFEGVGRHRKPTVYMRSGSEKGTGKIYDLWAKGIYGSTGQPTGQSVTILPDGRMDPHLEFKTGLLAQESFMISELMKQRNDQRERTLPTK